jgi:hypothetical protein
MAVEMGLHEERAVDEMSEAAREVRNATFWGAYILDQWVDPFLTYGGKNTYLSHLFLHRAWSLAASRLPQVSQGGVLIRGPTVFNRDELREWIPYADDQLPQGLYLRQPSNIRAVYNSLCELSRTIHSTLYVISADTGPLISQNILDRYTQMLAWYGSLPEVLRLGGNSTPSVLFVQ